MDHKMIGKRLSELRKAAEMSQDKLGTLLDISRVAVSKYETGSIHIKPENLLKIKEIFSISLDWFLTGEEPEKTFENVLNMMLTDREFYQEVTGLYKKWRSPGTTGGPPDAPLFNHSNTSGGTK